MLRLSAEDLNFPKYDDEDVINAWTWLRSFLSDKEWEKRKIDIENKILVEFKKTPPFSEPLTDGTVLLVKSDVIGWYLYLVYTLIYEPYKYEHFQGARVVPIFKRFGMNLNKLKAVNGIEKRIKNLLRKRPSEADAILFELLTALLWCRNGYEVSFLEEENGCKTPDIVAIKDGKSWFIECKRQSKTADYTYREIYKRQKMISYISKGLIQKNIILDIVFHVELETLPDTYLIDILKEKIQNPVAGKIVSNEHVDISLDFVNIKKIKKHLEKYLVKNHSPMLSRLIGGKAIDNMAFTCGVFANFYRVGDGEVNNLYISDIDLAFGIYCSCDAKEALWAKARNIKNQVFKAMQQFNSEGTSVIHVGLETFDGPSVEKIRFEKIKTTIEQIDSTATNLRWIFCNFFQAYSPPDQDWVFDETVSTISPYTNKYPPINEKMMIVEDDSDNINFHFHWDRPLP